MFFEYNQNNSGGSFDVDDKVCHWMFVEADNVDEANAFAENLGCYWDGVRNGQDCGCCGDRWHTPWGDTEFPVKWDDELSFQHPEEYAQHLVNEFGYFRRDQVEARVFYKDGRVVEIMGKR